MKDGYDLFDMTDIGRKQMIIRRTSVFAFKSRDDDEEVEEDLLSESS